MIGFMIIDTNNLERGAIFYDVLLAPLELV